jgi:hypothetical protein
VVRPLVFARDADGRPFAACAADDPGQAAILAAFLTDDVPGPQYAEELAVQADADAMGEAVGNAYVLVLRGQEAVIEALFLAEQPPAVLPRGDLAMVLRDWARFLRAG